MIRLVRAPTGTARSSAPSSTARPTIRSTRARPTPTSPTWPAREAAGAPDAVLSAVRHPTRTAWRRSRWPARQRPWPSTSSSACTAWASRCTSRWSARPPLGRPATVPHLRAGRHARDAAGLPGAPPARERRQHLVRQPHRRRASRSRPWSRTRSPPSTAGRRRRRGRPAAPGHPAAAGALRLLRANSEGWTSSTRPRCANWAMPCATRPGRSWDVTPLLARFRLPAGGRAGAQPANPRPGRQRALEATPAEVAGRRRPRAGGFSGLGRDAGRPRRLARARRRADAGRDPAADRPGVREAGKTCGQRDRRGARGGRLPALLRGPGPGRLPQRQPCSAGTGGLHQPWNFPLAIFTGQVAAALAAGNPCWPSRPSRPRSSPRRRSGCWHAAGVPRSALQLVTGRFARRRALVADPRVQGVMFTGSTEVARILQATLAQRLSAGRAAWCR